MSPSLITLAEKNQAQQNINNWCHGLAECDDTMTYSQGRARRVLAQNCVDQRQIVYQYYREQGLPDPGQHLRAIDHDDWVARSCGGG